MTSVALSIRQPWAWAILHGGKDVENRKWWTPYTGPFLIHAGKNVDQEGFNSLIEANIPIPNLEDLPRGGIVGRARIVGCVKHCDSTWFTGPYGFLLQDPEELPFAPLRGYLNFFNVDLEQRRSWQGIDRNDG